MKVRKILPVLLVILALVMAFSAGMYYNWSRGTERTTREVATSELKIE